MSAIPGPLLSVDENQQELSPPTGMYRLAYLWVVSGAGAQTYISLWGGTGTSRTAAERSSGPWPIPDGHVGPVLTELHARAGIVIAAHTASNATGAPASALEVIPFWEQG